MLFVVLVVQDPQHFDDALDHKGVGGATWWCASRQPAHTRAGGGRCWMCVVRCAYGDVVPPLGMLTVVWVLSLFHDLWGA